MLNDLPLIILARGGSKGVINKNLQKIGQDTLVEWSIKCAQQSQSCREIYLSSDSSQILDIAGNFDSVTPHMRSAKNSEDEASSVDALTEVIDFYDLAVRDQYICLLEPTFPFRSYSLIDKLYKLCLNTKADSGVVVRSIKRNPKNIFEKSDDGLLTRFIKDESINFSRRQEFENICRLSSGIYICKIKNILDGEIMKGVNVGLSDNSIFDINIDESQDLDYARYIFERYQDYDDFICSACIQ